MKCELESKLLKGGYVGDYKGMLQGLLRGILEVETMAHMGLYRIAWVCGLGL